MKHLLILLFSVLAPLVAQENAPDEAPLYGNWDLVKDDDRPPGTPVEQERLSIYPDGTLIISGIPVSLTYAVLENRFVVTATAGGETQTMMDREFTVDETWFRMKNNKQGYVHYRRSSDPLKPLVDTSVARTFKDEWIEIRVPAGFQNMANDDTSKAHYSFTHPETQIITQIMVSKETGAGDVFEITQKFSNEMLRQFPPEHQPKVETLEKDGFYNVAGKSIRFSKSFPEGTIHMSFLTTRVGEHTVFLFAQEMAPASGSTAAPILKGMFASFQVKGKKLVGTP
ncbi:hypothetical protein [Acanthopleuribacter pedis]|uniref:DUF3108 domain-containing protein n=1 Tax=Acanthopleuribacter pedis TaxID=442870 RepID=A0A8J7Q691_9BACT|nr:hypothetical protein [Acanthopleuribacter pedis]MBO1317434.1 hypothetical protein [Acanthopleuribacter pedis]